MFRTLFAALMGGVVLTGCGSMTASGMLTAARLDPLGTPPEALSMALSLPRNVQLKDGDATLGLVFTPEDAAAAAPVSVTVPLSIQPDAIAPEALLRTERVYVLKLGPEAAAAFADAQKQIIALKAADVSGDGSLGVSLMGGCVLTALVDELPVATWLRPEPASDWVPLTRRIDLFDALPDEQAAALRTALVPC